METPNIIVISEPNIGDLSTILPFIPDYYNSDDENVSTSDNALNSSLFLLRSWWDLFSEKYLRHSLGWSITLIVAYLFILAVGIIGNCMVILVVIFRPQMRTVTNIFIMNLATADLFVIFFVPVTLIANLFTPWILGWFLCKGVAYVQGVSVCASAYSLVAISLDRCKAIYRPLKRPRGLSKSQALFTICLIWLVALLLTIPWAVIFNVIVAENNGFSYCVETWKNEQHGKIYFLFVNLICCYCLPLVIISLSNVVVWYHVSHRKVPHDSSTVTIIKKMHRRTRHGVRKMLGIVTFTFLISWLPLYILVTRIKFSDSIGEDEANILGILMPLAQLLGSLNSSINPVLYAFLNQKFREMFKSLLPHWIPFVHRKKKSTSLKGTIDRETPTNGTISLGSAVSHSCATLLTTRSSGHSRTSSKHCSGCKSFYKSFPVTGLQRSASTVVKDVCHNKNNMGYNRSSTVIVTKTPSVNAIATITDL